MSTGESIVEGRKEKGREEEKKNRVRKIHEK